MQNNDSSTLAQRWARLRFAIIGTLLACPPKRGQLRVELERLAQRCWRHPSTGERVRFALSTLERWYYAARAEPRDPLRALQKARRKDAGTHSLNERLEQVLRAQHHQHSSWSIRLHYDNLLAVAATQPALGRVPSYNTVRRFMRANGLAVEPSAFTTSNARQRTSGSAC